MFIYLHRGVNGKYAINNDSNCNTHNDNVEKKFVSSDEQNFGITKSDSFVHKRHIVDALWS